MTHCIPPPPPPPSMTNLPYTDKDQMGDYTMLPGDIVVFNIAVDRRNGNERATNVLLHRLIEEQREKSSREQVSNYIVLYIPVNVLT